MNISWQYIAGIIDGEGSIGTTRTGKYRNVVGRVVVANTDSRLLYALQTVHKGTISIRPRGAKDGWKPFGSIAWSCRQAEYLLEKVLPFLIIKKEQALICLELIRMRDKSKQERFDYVKSPIQIFQNRVVVQLKPEIRRKEEYLTTELRRLNKRGI